MRKEFAVGIAVLVVVLLPLAGLTAAQPFDAAQGGGQVVLSGQDLSRAGNTISFSVQSPRDVISGSVEYLETSVAGGEDPSRVPSWHGVPTCLRVDGSVAEIGGSIVRGTSTAAYFALLVTDNGSPAEGTDTIQIQYPDSQPNCMADWSNVAQQSLARGNVTVNDAA
jgi:hypothetical protein